MQALQETLDKEFTRLEKEQADLAQRMRQLERTTPALTVLAAALQAQGDAREAHNRRLTRLLEETRPCEEPAAAMELASRASASLPTTTEAGQATPAMPGRTLPEVASSDALRLQIDELTRELARQLEEKARLDDEAGWLERDNALLDRQRAALQQENDRRALEAQAL